MKNVKVIKDHKFKNTLISVRILSPLVEEKILPKMILSNVLNDVCKKYDTKQKVSSQLDKMYGSSFSVSSSVIGDAQVIVAKVKSIHSSYIKGELNLLEEQFALLSEFLLNPLMEDGSFLKEQFEEAKNVQRSYMKRTMDDPSACCMYEALKIAGKDQPLGIGANPSLEDIDQVSLNDINNEYNALINDYRVDILVFGDVEEDEVNDLATKYLSPLAHDEKEEVKANYLLEYKDMEKVQYGYRDITQSYITSIYTTSISNDDPDFKSLRVANAIFGQLPSSLLFQNIREKNSLCYSIYSAINPYDGALGISTGVEKVNVDKTLNLIDEQYQKMLDGEFDDNLIETSKKMIINSLLSTNDDINSILALEYRNLILNKNEKLEDIIADIESVSKEDVVNAMKKTQYVMSYVLTQKGDAENNEKNQ